jgi:hypothetical protein
MKPEVLLHENLTKAEMYTKNSLQVKTNDFQLPLNFEFSCLFKGIVTRNWGGLQIVSLYRYKV